LKVLLVYPRYPDTFWSFRHALKVAGKKASFPPLGLLTVAAMLPDEWDKKLVDMNVKPLRDDDIKWADYVFISAMVVQRDSVADVIERCKRYNTIMVAGGPLFTAGYEYFDDVDHLVLDEAEITLPPFLEDLEKGCAKHIYTSKERPDITKTPLPMWSLLEMNKYSSTNIQYSRGCPYNCDFCDIIILNGNVPRTNFIGNKKKLKGEILPAMIEWQKARKYPSMLLTETSINLADDDKLMDLMVEAGFDTVFIGIESPNEESLAECSKHQNRKRDLVASVKRIQNHGLQVQGGFILGFDNDPLSIFRSQINFIQKSGIVTAMVGLLNAPPETKLYQRLEKENRLLEISTISGDNTDCTMNFIPKMDRETLLNGYKSILATIYSPKEYYKRVKIFLKEYKPRRKKRLSQLQYWHVRALLRSLWFLGVVDRGRLHYWRFMFSTLFKRPQHFPLSVSLAVYGFHFRKVACKYLGTPVKDAAA